MTDNVQMSRYVLHTVISAAGARRWEDSLSIQATSRDDAIRQAEEECEIVLDGTVAQSHLLDPSGHLVWTSRDRDPLLAQLQTAPWKD